MYVPTMLSVRLQRAWPRGSNSTKTRSDVSPSHVIVSSTSKGYFMSPSTKPGVSMNVTKLNLFCFDVEISVVR